MSSTEKSMPAGPARDEAASKEWATVLEQIRAGVPADVTEEEIERDVAEAIEEARQQKRASRP
jgi:hypothetical protein